MADITSSFAIRRIPLTAAWLPLVPPFDCGEITIQNTDGTNAIQLRTDAADGATEKTIALSTSLTLRGTANEPTFPAGRPVVSLAANAGAPVACVSFLR